MNKFIMALAMGLGLTTLAHAADTSASIVVRKFVTPVGTSPQIGYTHADVTSAAVSANRMTFDVPAPRGSANIVGYMPASYNVSGSQKPLNITRSGNTITVTGSNMTSGTMAVSDSIRVITIYNP